MAHAGHTVTVETADTTFRVYAGDELLIEVARTTTRLIARFKVANPNPHDSNGTARSAVNAAEPARNPVA
jgi:hypothetical protein